MKFKKNEKGEPGDNYPNINFLGLLRQVAFLKTVLALVIRSMDVIEMR